MKTEKEVKDKMEDLTEQINIIRDNIEQGRAYESDHRHLAKLCEERQTLKWVLY